MVVPSAETDFVGDFRRKTYHLHFLRLHRGETLVQFVAANIAPTYACCQGCLVKRERAWTRDGHSVQFCNVSLK